MYSRDNPAGSVASNTMELEYYLHSLDGIHRKATPCFSGTSYQCIVPGPFLKADAYSGLNFNSRLWPT